MLSWSESSSTYIHKPNEVMDVEKVLSLSRQILVAGTVRGGGWGEGEMATGHPGSRHFAASLFIPGPGGTQRPQSRGPPSCTTITTVGAAWKKAQGREWHQRVHSSRLHLPAVIKPSAPDPHGVFIIVFPALPQPLGGMIQVIPQSPAGPQTCHLLP